MWYDQTPAEYAHTLRWYAARDDESVAARRAAPGHHFEHDIRHTERQARRLRAMALLCDRSTAATAGDMDFRGLMNPGNSWEHEEAVISQIEKEAASLAA